MNRTNLLGTVLFILTVLGPSQAINADVGLADHWKLNGDCLDSSGKGNNGINHGATLYEERSMARARTSRCQLAIS